MSTGSNLTLPGLELELFHISEFGLYPGDPARTSPLVHVYCFKVVLLRVSEILCLMRRVGRLGVSAGGGDQRHTEQV